MRKRTRRKVYALMNPVSLAIEGAGIATQKALDQLRVRELQAIDGFAKGHATEANWYDLSALTMLCLEMAQNGIGPEAIEPCATARAFLNEDMERFNKTGKMGTTGPGLQAYRDVFEYHDLQRQSIARSEYERHIKKVTARVKFDKSID